MDNSLQIIQGIIKFIRVTHEKHADGCKSSCCVRDVGYCETEFSENHWYCNFGGYCFGNMPRNSTVKAPTLEALDKRVREVIHKSITDDEYQFESDK